MRIQRSLRSNHSQGKPEEKGSPAHRLELGLGQLDDAGFEFRPVVALVLGVAGKVAKRTLRCWKFFVLRLPKSISVSSFYTSFFSECT